MSFISSPCVFPLRLSPKGTRHTETSSSSTAVKATAWSTTSDQSKHVSPAHRKFLHRNTSPANFCLLFRQIIYIITCSTIHKVNLLFLFWHLISSTLWDCFFTFPNKTLFSKKILPQVSGFIKHNNHVVS